MARKKSSTSEMDAREKVLTPPARRLNELITDNNALKEHLGVSLQAINQYRLGIARPTLENLCKIADFYGVSVDWILERTNAKTIQADAAAAFKYTGLSEKALKVLHDLHNAPFEGVALNRNGITYEISYITLLSKLLEIDEDFRQIFQQLAYFMLYSEALPEQAYETRKIKLSSDESEHFRIWIERHRWELIPNDEARELHLQSAGEKFKAIYRKILENETVKGDGRQWQALKKR